MSRRVSSLRSQHCENPLRCCEFYLLLWLWASVGGSISGTVKDPSGRVIPNAHVTVREIKHRAFLPDPHRQQGLLHLPGAAGRPL